MKTTPVTLQETIIVSLISGRALPTTVNFDPLSRQMRNYNNSSLHPSKRANIGNAMSSVTQEQVTLTVLQPSQVANVAGNSTMHAMKGGQKLIRELYDVKNEVYINAILHEAAWEGFSKSLSFPNRSKWF
jgi:hypothetical protein